MAAIFLVYARCRFSNTHKRLTNGWLVRTAAQAAPLPVYALLLLAPLDPDLIEALMQDRIVVALAGLYGIVETVKDVRRIAKDTRKGGTGYH